MRTLIALLVCVTCCPAFASQPHPFHTSIAEVEYNPDSKRLEVALKLYAVDAETALTQLAGKACDLDNEKQRDPLLKRYLLARFSTESVKPPRKGDKAEGTDKKPKTESTLRYIGSEIDGANLWAYFELPVPKPGEFLMRNEVLTEVQQQQLNVVRFRGPAGEQTLFFSSKNKRCSLSLKRKVIQKQPTK